MSDAEIKLFTYAARARSIIAAQTAENERQTILRMCYLIAELANEQQTGVSA